MRSLGGLRTHPIAYLRWLLDQMVALSAPSVRGELLPVATRFTELLDQCEAAAPTRTMSGTTIFFPVFDLECVSLAAYHILL